ncbi:MAG: hypothetical protein HYY01_10035 [Chloroflexi bacterium]|nr:hypothetical protein [Chloroflexota bacterium]
MKLARLARDWVFVVGTPIGVFALIGRHFVLGAGLIAFFALSAYLLHRAAEVARRSITAEGKTPARAPAILLLWGQVLVLLNVLGLAFLQTVAALWLLVATLPPGLMALAAWFQLRRRSDARLPR